MSMQQMILEQQRQASMTGGAGSAASAAGAVRKFPVGSMFASMRNVNDLGLLKTKNRWTYFQEYLRFWLEGKKYTVYSAMALMTGVMLLASVPLLAVIAFFFSAKFYTTAQVQLSIAKKYGKGRAVVVVN